MNRFPGVPESDFNLCVGRGVGELGTSDRTPSNSQIPAGSPRIQLHSNTIYLETAVRSHKVWAQSYKTRFPSYTLSAQAVTCASDPSVIN